MNALQIIKPGTYWCNYSAIAWPDNSSGSNRCMDDKSIKPNYNIYLNAVNKNNIAAITSSLKAVPTFNHIPKYLDKGDGVWEDA